MSNLGKLKTLKSRPVGRRFALTNSRKLEKWNEKEGILARELFFRCFTTRFSNRSDFYDLFCPLSLHTRIVFLPLLVLLFNYSPYNAGT
jgi:hypothetical protein